MHHSKIIAIAMLLLIALADWLPVRALSGSASPFTEENLPASVSGDETAGIVDFNGDGYADLAVGSNGDNVGDLNWAGGVNVLYGSASGLTVVGDQLWNQDSPDVEDAAEYSDFFGEAVASGDFNGDGFTDLAVGAPGEEIDGNSSAGAVNVLYGSAAGLSAAGDQFWHQNSPDVEGDANLLDYFGGALASGDFNGDGFADLAVGVKGEDIAGYSWAGAVNVLYGSAAGLSAAGDQLWHQDSPGVEGAAGEGDNFGQSLAAANFGKSSHADLAIGVPGEEVDGAAEAGAVNVLYGRASGLSATGDQLWTQNSTDVEGDATYQDSFGHALAAANFGNSAHADLAVGVPGEDVDGNDRAGAVNVLYGTASGFSAVSDQFWSQNSPSVDGAANPDDRFGESLAAANFGKSSQADLAVGVPYENIDGKMNAGAVNVLYGSASGLTAAGDQFWHQNITDVEDTASEDDSFGYALAGANFGNTSQADLAVGAACESFEGIGCPGAVNVLYGTATGLSAAGDQFWHQNITDVEGEAEYLDQFGFALAAGR